MSILLVDIGNTRVKWALLRGGRLGRGGAIAHDGRAAAIGCAAARCGQGRAARDRRQRRWPEAELQRWRRPCASVSALRVEFVASTRRAGGVTNGYREVWRLGADRWVAAIGAHAMAQGRDVLFAMAGTALTIDLVIAGGRHRGGAIIPGPATMVASLLSGTHGIRRRARGLKAQGRRLFASRHRQRAGRGFAVRRRGLHRPRLAGSLARIGRPAAAAVERGGAVGPAAAHRDARCARSRISCCAVSRAYATHALATLAPRVRAVLLVLLLLNLAFFAWSQWLAPERGRVARVAQGGRAAAAAGTRSAGRW